MSLEGERNHECAKRTKKNLCELRGFVVNILRVYRNFGKKRPVRCI